MIAVLRRAIGKSESGVWFSRTRALRKFNEVMVWCRGATEKEKLKHKKDKQNKDKQNKANKAEQPDSPNVVSTNCKTRTSLYDLTGLRAAFGLGGSKLLPMAVGLKA